MNAHDFDQGDGFNSPRISGYDTLYERISEDMLQFPWRYHRWEISLFHCVPQDSYDEYWLDVRSFIDHWCKEHESLYDSHVLI